MRCRREQRDIGRWFFGRDSKQICVARPNRINFLLARCTLNRPLLRRYREGVSIWVISYASVDDTDLVVKSLRWELFLFNVFVVALSDCYIDSRANFGKRIFLDAGRLQGLVVGLDCLQCVDLFLDTGHGGGLFL